MKGHACSARVQAAVEGVVALCREHNVDAEAIRDLYIGIPSIFLAVSLFRVPSMFRRRR